MQSTESKNRKKAPLLVSNHALRMPVAMAMALANCSPGLVVEQIGGLAKIQPHITSVAWAESGVVVVWVLIYILAQGTGSASDLDTGAGAFAITSWADLDVVVCEWSANQSRASSIKVTKIPEEAARAHGVLELEDTIRKSGVLRYLDRCPIAICNPVEGKNRGCTVPCRYMPWVGRASPSGALIATAVVGLVYENIRATPVVYL